MASAELLKMTNNVDSKVVGVDNRVKGVDDRVKDVEGKVQDVEHSVQNIGNNISCEVQGVDHKLDQANRSLSLESLLLVPSTQTPLQGSSLEKIFCDGFHPQTHPPIITSHATLITTARPNGFFKELYSINGNLLAPYCGYTESVRYFRPLPSFDS